MSFTLPPSVVDTTAVAPRTLKDLSPADHLFIERFTGRIITSIFEADWALDPLSETPEGRNGPRVRVYQTPLVENLHNHEGYGCFFSVNGFNTSKATGSQNMRTGEALSSINCFYIDIDWPKRATMPKTPENVKAFKNEVIQDFVRMAADGQPSPTAVVESKNGIHAYWLLKKPIFLNTLTREDGSPDTTRIERVLSVYRETQKAIIARFLGDDKASDPTRVLRIPGTFHWKDKEPFKIRLVWDEGGRDERTYLFKDIVEFFATGRAAEEAPHHRYFAAYADEASQVFYLSGDTQRASPAFKQRLVFRKARFYDPLPPEVLIAVNQAYPKTSRPSIQRLMSKVGIPEGERNTSLLIAASAMRESGMTQTDIEDYFADGYNALTLYEIKQTIASAFRSARPYEFGWNHPLIGPYVTTEEAARVKVAVRTLAKEFYASQKEAVSEDEELARQEQEKEREKEREREREKAKIQEAEQNVRAPLNKETQKEVYRVCEFDFARINPGIKYVEGRGFYQYQDGFFKPLEQEDVRSKLYEFMMLSGLLDFREASRVRSKLECFMSLESVRVTPTDVDKDHYLNVRNGLLDMRNMQLVPHTSQYFSTSQVPFRYDPEETATPLFNAFLNTITASRVDKQRFLQEMFGYCLTPSVGYQVAFLLIGTGANGKSTLIEVLQRLLGMDACSSLTLDQLVRPFMCAGLFGKKLNVVEEISNNYFESDQIKRLITGQEITADRKFKTALRFKPFAKFIFAVNRLPRVNDNSEALFRRFKVIEFPVVIPVNDRDPNMVAKLMTEASGILNWAIEGLRRLHIQGGFSHYEGEEEALDMFRSENSPITEFLVSKLVRADAGAPPISLEDVYRAYESFCRTRNYGLKSMTNFREELRHLSHSALRHVRLDSKEEYVFGLRFPTNTALASLTSRNPFSPTF